MDIKVRFLKDGISDVFSVGRVPCIGEKVLFRSFTSDIYIYVVKDVIHLLNANPETEVSAYVDVE